MAEKRLSDTTDEGELNPGLVKTFDRVLSVQRPLVVANIRRLRRAHPNATPADLIRILERNYLGAVTAGGAAVGASAAVPAVGTVTSIALTATETAGFLEASALFAQSVAEIHGIAVIEPERARTLVMTLIMGAAGQDLVKQFAGGGGRNAYWGELITRNLPKGVVTQLTNSIKRRFFRRFVLRQGTSMVGRLIPFGIGAVVGGTGNHLLGRQVVKSARDAFPPAPIVLPGELEPPAKDAGTGRERRTLRLPFRRKPAATGSAASPEAPDTASGSGD
jgi:hypothetical protein